MHEEDRLHELLYLGRMNIFYHERCERRFGLWLNWTSMASLILASASFAALSDSSWLAGLKYYIIAAASLTVTVLNSAVLAFGMVEKNKLHSDLKRQWSEFYGKLFVIDENDQYEISRLHKEMAKINSSEPAPLRSLLKKAQIDATRSMGLEPPEEMKNILMRMISMVRWKL